MSGHASASAEKAELLRKICEMEGRIRADKDRHDREMNNAKRQAKNEKELLNKNIVLLAVFFFVSSVLQLVPNEDSLSVYRFMIRLNVKSRVFFSGCVAFGGAGAPACHRRRRGDERDSGNAGKSRGGG